MYDSLHLAAWAAPALLSSIESGAPSILADRARRILPEMEATLNGNLKMECFQIQDGDPPQLEVLRAQAVSYLSDLRTRGVTHTVPLSELLEPSSGDSGNHPGRLISSLASLGVNPAGNELHYQRFKDEGRWRRWIELFGQEPFGSSWSDHLTPDALEFRVKLMHKVRSDACSVLFNRLYFGFESAGLGVPTLDLDAKSFDSRAERLGVEPSRLRAICESLLRILGELFRYPRRRILPDS